MTDDILVPSPDSGDRKSNLVVATFNLSATIVGGAVLALPMAFSKCGIILGTLLMIFAAVITDRSLYLLCLCGRRTGAASFGEVGKAAFGESMEYFITFLLFVFLLFVLVAFMVLISDIWTSVVELSGLLKDHPDPDMVLLFIIFCMTPFLIQKTLYALRYNCYIGFGAVSMLCIALCHHAIEEAHASSNGLPANLVWWSTSLNDLLFAFPIITLSFLSVFNILPIQGALIKPDRSRIKFVISGAVGSCFVLMQLFAVGGYLYAGTRTQGNILLNCEEAGDWMFVLGRLGCGVTIMLALPMVLLPCRASGLELLDLVTNRPHNVSGQVGQQSPADKLSVVVGEESPLMGNHRTNMVDDATAIIQTKRSLSDNAIVRYIATFCIVVTCYTTAIRVPGVALVWSLCGSSMAFLVAFILPASCFLKIDSQHPSPDSRVWVIFSWFLLIFSIVGSVACTAQTIISLF